MRRGVSADDTQQLSTGEASRTCVGRKVYHQLSGIFKHDSPLTSRLNASLTKFEAELNRQNPTKSTDSTREVAMGRGSNESIWTRNVFEVCKLVFAFEIMILMFIIFTHPGG
jgi:hypothetical protein